MFYSWNVAVYQNISSDAVLIFDPSIYVKKIIITYNVIQYNYDNYSVPVMAPSWVNKSTAG